MSFRRTALAGAVLPILMLAPVGASSAADLGDTIKAKPLVDLPFFLVNNNMLSYGYEFTATDPGAFSLRPDGSINGKTTKQIINFTHFDVWAYGTNFITMSVLKSNHNDPASPCANAGVLLSGAAADCAGATEFYGLFRSTLGFNEVFNTKAFSFGPLSNVSLEVGGDFETENILFGPQKRDVGAGLQFAFDLPYKGHFNVAPLFYKEWNHDAFEQCGLFGAGVPGMTCLADGSVDYKPTWALELTWNMDLGFLPQSVQYFSLSGRAGW
jgi:hypothetical protein